MKSYVAIVEPALLCAVTRNVYHVSGFKSRTRNSFCSILTLFDTSVQDGSFLSLYSTTIDVIGQPPSFHDVKFNDMDVEFTRIRSELFGAMGAKIIKSNLFQQISNGSINN